MTMKVAWVSGAGSGIGRAAAIGLAEAGFAVALVGRRRGLLEETAEACDGETLVIPADVGVASEVEGAILATVQGLGGLDVLVNNAGVAEVVPVEKTTPEVLERAFRTNTFSAAYAMRAAWGELAKRQGRIVNVSSVATIDPFPGFFAYAASKAALNLMTASAAKEGASVGIRAFAVAPGAVETPMLRASFDTKAVPPEACLKPETVAEVIVACATGRRDVDSGRVIPVVPEAARQWLHGWFDAHPPLRG